MTEHLLGKGTAVVLAWDASFALFAPGQPELQAALRRHLLGALAQPYSCEGAVVYRLAAPAADHYFFINDNPARAVTLATPGYRYRKATDAISGETLVAGAPIQLEPYSGRWVRMSR